MIISGSPSVLFGGRQRPKEAREKGHDDKAGQDVAVALDVNDGDNADEVAEGAGQAHADEG